MKDGQNFAHLFISFFYFLAETVVFRHLGGSRGGRKAGRGEKPAGVRHIEPS